MSGWTYDSRAYRKALRAIQHTGPPCVLCGHPGSDSIHHLLPTSRFPEVAGDPANWAPAHGVRGCPTCAVRCNQSQGNSVQPRQVQRRSRRW